MAFIPCVSGEIETPTLLWTNPNPTNNFTGQTVTLSDNISNYNWLLFKVKPYKTDTTFYYIAQPLQTTPGGEFGFLCCRDVNGSVVRFRTVKKITDTTLEIEVEYNVGYNNQDNDYCIPIEIYGLKKALI